jgi:fructose-1,6-bisphosphatase/inositol monophosphatase family enzyme
MGASSTGTRKPNLPQNDSTREKVALIGARYHCTVSPMRSAPDVDAVTRLIDQVATDIVLPRFGVLRQDEIDRKPAAGHQDDLVTVVDREAEARLSRELMDMIPSAQVLGEEAAYADPSALSRVHSDDPLWIIDPLDGTRNFAAGSDAFGIMVGFAIRGEVRAAWVHLPARGECFVAEAGSGTYRNGMRVRVPADPSWSIPRGTFLVRFMPAHVRDSVRVHAAGRYADSGQTGAAAIEYTDVLHGRKDFAVYFRLLPWDHGAPSLLLTEAGGRVEHVGGHAYSVRSAHQLTIAARDPETASRVRQWLEPVAGIAAATDR